MSRADDFLQLYKRLETAAGLRVGENRRGSPVVALFNSPRYSRYRQDVDYCREIRNLLSHEVKLGGEYPVEPGENVISLLTEIVNEVENPTKAIDRATLVADLVVTTPDEPVVELAGKMRLRGLSNVPLLENGVVTGVFSENTVFQYVLERGSAKINSSTPVSEFSDYLPIARHIGSAFVFADQGTYLFEASEIFDKAYQRERKLRMLFITDNGSRSGKLLGVLTPYDLLDTHG